MLTTKQAAEYLGISMARIRQLIANGQVVAERQGKSWLVSQESLDAYAATAAVGRPSRREAAAKKATTPSRYILMSCGFEVARCVYDPMQRRFTQLELLDGARAPLALVSYRTRNGGMCHAFNEWWGSRAIPQSRASMPVRMAELGVSSTFEIPLRNNGLSLSDQYWLRPEGSATTWEQINYYRNLFDLGPVDVQGRVGSSAGEWLNAVGLNSPDNTTDGMLRKRWILDEEGQRVLLKGNGESGREVYNEILATMLYRRLLPSWRYVEYRLASWRGHDVSACASFLQDNEEFISAWYVARLFKKPSNHSAYQHYCETCETLGIVGAQRQLDRMLVCDSLLANTDRHWGNFGIIRNVETLEYRPAPIFDTGSSLWSHTTIRDLAAGDYRFTTKPFYENPKRQLDMVYDATWYHPEALVGYVDEVREYLVSIFKAENPADVVCKGLEQRIEAVNAWSRKAPTAGLSPELQALSETLEWVWLD